MIHRHLGHKLGLVPHQRKALMRQLTLAILEHESIRTTRARAAALVWFADHMVTLAKSGDEASRRRIFQILGSTKSQSPGENRVTRAVANLYDSVVPRFKDRQGGYTQTILLAKRRPGDNAEMCLFQYLPGPESKTEKTSEKKDKKTKKVAKSKEPQDKREARSKEPEDKPEAKKKK